MSLRSVNLNLVPVLRALLRERNLSRAAESLGVTQPAVSAALTNLRAIFGDPLLIRQGHAMELTIRAHELIEAVEAICTSLEELVGNEEFEPEKSERRFVILGSDYSVMKVGATLIRHLAVQAPRISVHFVDLTSPALDLHLHEFDVLIIPAFLLQDGRYPMLRSIPLIHDDFVTVVAEDHRLARLAAPTQADLLEANYVVYHPALTMHDVSIIQAISEGERGRRVVAHVQQFGLLPSLAIDTGSAAIVPRGVAEYMKRFLPIREVEQRPTQFDLNLSLAWNVANNYDPGHRWLRKLLIDHCTSLGDRS